ncbi:MAG TPA: hypothetical protein VHZ03_07050 [Trebonia sp.]|jgi:tetratricopeptide (TPR) repeat protein|nr:hypothetical protein [Trebonia sp.]
MITVFGRRGIGKSSLAAKVVETLATPGSGYRGIASLSTRIYGPITVERVFFTCADLASPAIRGALDALWASQREPREKVLLLFETLGDGLNLIVLDNIEDQLTDNGQSVSTDLLTLIDAAFRAPKGPRLLITSQVPVALDPALRRMEARLHLRDGLPVADSVALLRELDRDGDAGLLAAPDIELERAARRLYGVPRALELAVGALAGDDLTLPTLDEVLKSFTARGDIVDQLAQDRHRRLDSESRLTLDVLAVFRTPVQREQVEWVMRPLAPHLDVARALSELTHVHMASIDRRSREFALHPMDADIAYSALPQTGPFSHRTLERRVAAWYQHTRAQPPWRSVTDVATHRRAFEHLFRAGDYDACAFILDDIAEFLALRGSGSEVVTMHTALSGHLTEDAAILADLVSFGAAGHICGPYADAVEPLRRAVELADRLGDLPRLGRALFALGDMLRFLRQLDEAVGTLARAAAVARQLDEVEHQAHALLCLSLAHTYLGSLPEALAVAGQIAKLAEASGEPLVAGRACDALSAANIASGRWDDAYQAGDQAVRAYQEAGVPEAIGYARNVQGIALLGKGRTDEAIAQLEGARMDSVTAETPRAEALCYFNLAWAQWMAGDYDGSCAAAHGAFDAFSRAGGADIDASQHLVAATKAMRDGDLPAARAALSATASFVSGNADLIPGEWLLSAVDRLQSRALLPKPAASDIVLSGPPTGPEPATERE